MLKVWKKTGWWILSFYKKGSKIKIQK